MAGYDAEDLNALAWLDDIFFEKALQNSENDPSIAIIEVGKLQPTGESAHFGSIMLRTTVRYRSNRLPEEQAISLIIKAKPTAEGFRKEITKDSDLFKTEIRMYSEVLPAMAKLLEDVGEHLEIPRLINISLEPTVLLVLEDLSPKGWKTGDECVQSFEEALFTVRNIAKFHATSYYLQQTNVDLTDFSLTEFVNSGPILAIYDRGFDDFFNGIKKWPGIDLYIDKLKKLKSSFEKHWRQVYAVNPATVGYNVLNHADFHWKNLMHIRNSEGRIVDSLMLDYQNCHWGSPAIDVLSMIDCIVDNGTKTAHRNEFIYEYHQHFSMILNKIGFLGKIPSLVDLQIEILRKGFIELMQSAIMEWCKHTELTEPTIDKCEAEELDVKPCYYNEKFQSLIRAELASLLHRGIMDPQ